MEKKTISTMLVTVALMATLLLAGCQAAAEDLAVPTDPFTTTYSFSGEDCSFSISGNTAGHMAGETSEFRVTMDNLAGDSQWQGEYCVLLVDQNSILKAVARKQYDVAAGSKTYEPIPVEFPEGFQGPLGLCVVFPERAATVTTLWVGTDRTGNAGPWPNISACP